MKTVIFAGGNKEISGARLGIKLAEALAAKGRDVVLMGFKGKIKTPSGLQVKEIAPAAKAASVAKTLTELKAGLFISFMNVPMCQAALAANVPFVYCEPDGFKEEKPFKDKKTVLKQAQKVLVIVKEGQVLNKKAYAGLKASAVTNPAVWVERYNYQKPAFFKKDNNIVASGKLVKESGFDVLLQTWARLAPAHGSWHLTIVGDGTGKAALLKTIQKHNLSASTEIVSDDGDVYSVLRNADIYVYPVRGADGHEALLDAMACKLPCLACDVPGVSDYIVNGVNGVIVNPAEEEALTVALDELMVNWGKRVGLAIEAAKQKDRFPFAAFVAAFED